MLKAERSPKLLPPRTPLERGQVRAGDEGRSKLAEVFNFPFKI